MDCLWISEPAGLDDGPAPLATTTSTGAPLSPMHFAIGGWLVRGFRLTGSAAWRSWGPRIPGRDRRDCDWRKRNQGPASQAPRKRAAPGPAPGRATVISSPGASQALEALEAEPALARRVTDERESAGGLARASTGTTRTMRRWVTDLPPPKRSLTVPFWGLILFAGSGSLPVGSFRSRASCVRDRRGQGGRTVTRRPRWRALTESLGE